jgi:hypothetical protein
MKIKNCFFISPISEPETSIRRSTDGLIDSVIHPLMGVFEITLNVSHRIYESGQITTQIIKHLLEDDLVIANLSGLNPNVMYELAVRHACAKPAIIIFDYDTKLPFDIANQRAIRFVNDFKGALELKSELEKMIKAVDDEKSPSDNPVYNTLKGEAIIKSLDNNSPENYMVKMLQEINQKLSTISSSSISPSRSNSSKGYASPYHFVTSVDNLNSDQSWKNYVDIDLGNLPDLKDITFPNQKSPKK